MEEPLSRIEKFALSVLPVALVLFVLTVAVAAIDDTVSFAICVLLAALVALITYVAKLLREILGLLRLLINTFYVDVPRRELRYQFLPSINQIKAIVSEVWDGIKTKTPQKPEAKI